MLKTDFRFSIENTEILCILQIVCSQGDDEDGIRQAFFSVINIIDKIKGSECPETKSLVVIITERKAIEILLTSHRCRLLPRNEDFTESTY